MCMDPLPMAPAACSLDASGFAAQRERYRVLAAASIGVERTSSRVAVRVDQHVPGGLIEELIAVERDCCPFFELTWDPVGRVFTASVSDVQHQPALDAIAYALELQEHR